MGGQQTHIGLIGGGYRFGTKKTEQRREGEMDFWLRMLPTYAEQ
jgi:hypothetical protein